MGLSTRNVEKVIKLVLEKLAGIKCDRLLKSTFSKYMLIEARGLAQLQIASELADCEEDLVLQSDRTSKKGYSFTTFYASKSNGHFHVGDVNEFAKKDFSEIFFSSVKNLMSDRFNTQKKFNKLFIDYRSTVLPKIKSNWNGLSEGEKAKHLNIYQYFCGLHFLVALADTSEAFLKV